MDVGVEFDPQLIFDHPDPYPMFAMMRASMPVMRTEFMNRTAYTVAKYDDCVAVLKDAETYSSRSNAEVGKVMGRTVIEMDGKEHTRNPALGDRHHRLPEGPGEGTRVGRGAPRVPAADHRRPPRASGGRRHLEARHR